MLLTFREMQRQVQAKIQNTLSSTDDEDDFLPKLKDWINQRYQRIYRAHPWNGTVDNYSLQMSASQEEYTFDRDFERLVGIYDSTNAKPITIVGVPQHLRMYAPTLNSTTYSSTMVRLIGIYSVKNKVSSAEKMSVVSSSSLDISPNVVHIVGKVSGVELGEDIVLTGTSAVDSVNTYDASQKLLVSVGTSDATRKTVVGAVTVTGKVSTTVMAQISPMEMAHSYQWFRVFPIPAATGTQPTFDIWYQKILRMLTGDNDIPILDCSQEIVQGTFADALRDDGLEQEAQAAEEVFKEMVLELKATRGHQAEIEQFIPNIRVPNGMWSASSYDWI